MHIIKAQYILSGLYISTNLNLFSCSLMALFRKDLFTPSCFYKLKPSLLTNMQIMLPYSFSSIGFSPSIDSKNFSIYWGEFLNTSDISRENDCWFMSLTLTLLWSKLIISIFLNSLSSFSFSSRSFLRECTINSWFSKLSCWIWIRDSFSERIV